LEKLGIIACVVHRVDFYSVYSPIFNKSRALSILALYPLLKRMGYGFDLKLVGLLVASGLRGAVSLTLSLIVVLNDQVDPDIGYLVAFHVSGIVLLTTLINGYFWNL
jgi:NhaP-type Na+/H+ and K+/H+ antiporter